MRIGVVGQRWMHRTTSHIRFQEAAAKPEHTHISALNSSSTPGVFYAYLYNHAYRPRLEKLLYRELSGSSNGYFKPLLDPGRRFQKRNGRYVTASEAKLP